MTYVYDRETNSFVEIEETDTFQDIIEKLNAAQVSHKIKNGEVYIENKHIEQANEALQVN